MELEYTILLVLLGIVLTPWYCLGRNCRKRGWRDALRGCARLAWRQGCAVRRCPRATVDLVLASLRWGRRRKGDKYRAKVVAVQAWHPRPISRVLAAGL